MGRRPAVALVAALGAGAVLLASACGSVGHTEGGEATRGEALFKEKCGSCHALGAAGTRSTVGPNLDEAFDDVYDQGFDESTVRDVVRDQIAYPVSNPPTADTPGMPDQDELFPKCEDGENPDDTGCFTDPDAAAEAVAAFVAQNAGKPGQGTPSGGVPPGTTDGKEIFTAAGCGSCHTLRAAGTSGTVGPNLDEAGPTLELAIDRVTNGQGVMPSFKGQLTEEQIRAVAEYVASNAGK
jgi:mono/diheme cytochrome c family protein